MQQWFIFGGGIGVQLLIAAYVYGKLTESVSANTTEIKRLQDSENEQWRKINSTREDVSKIKGKLGMNGA